MVPVTLPLGGDFRTEVTQSLGWGGASSNETLTEESVQDIRFVLLLHSYLGSQATDLSGPPSPFSVLTSPVPFASLTDLHEALRTFTAGRTCRWGRAFFYLPTVL